MAIACVRGRCPCWPQTEPFDDAEMALLKAMRTFVDWKTVQECEFLWAQVQTCSLAVRRSRRPYVLSTFIAYPTCAFLTRTLLGWVEGDTEKQQWLLDVGVCPNISATRFDRPATSGWTGGPVHPGRPLAIFCTSPLEDKPSVRGTDLLLAVGAYPVHRQAAYVLQGCVLPVPLGVLRRRWRGWHARASRRLWAALGLQKDCVL
jgi:hypothetical protein